MCKQNLFTIRTYGLSPKHVWHRIGNSASSQFCRLYVFVVLDIDILKNDFYSLLGPSINREFILIYKQKRYHESRITFDCLQGINQVYLPKISIKRV